MLVFLSGSQHSRRLGRKGHQGRKQENGTNDVCVTYCHICLSVAVVRFREHTITDLQLQHKSVLSMWINYQIIDLKSTDGYNIIKIIL